MSLLPLEAHHIVDLYVWVDDLLPRPEHPNDAANDSIAATVRESQDAFHSALPNLLKDFPEKWVAFSGSLQISIADSRVKLIRECLARGYSGREFVTFHVEPDFPIVAELLPNR